MTVLLITVSALFLAMIGCGFSGSAMPIVDPDPAGIGTYLTSAVLLALGIAIFSTP